MRWVWVLALLAACTSDPGGPQPPDRQVRCEPASAGLEGGTPLPIPGVELPEACTILEDDPALAVFRRQVTPIRSEAALADACHLTDPAPIAGLIDFATEQLLLVRIPDIAAPSWAIVDQGQVTIGEQTTECSGVVAKARRYVVKVPATSTVGFHLCQPLGCEEDPDG